jgi:phospholipid/cholesterol/gamma-HCH transport system substrate-binding protein
VSERRLRMPTIGSFRDRNPYLVGLVSVGLIAAAVGFAMLVGLFHLFESTYTVRAVFPDTAGLRSGDDVKLAGISAGRISAIEPDRETGTVVVTFQVDRGVQLGSRPTAEIALQTLLGTKYLRLGGQVTEPYLADLPEDQRVIPLERTATPFDVFELARIGTRAVEATDTGNLNRLVNDLADVTEGRRPGVTDLIEGIDAVAGALNEREAQLRELIDQADGLTATLADKDRTLVALIDQSRAILELLSARQGDIAAGLRSGNAATGELARLISDNRTQLQEILDTLHPTLDIVDRRSAELDRVLAWAGPGQLQQARATSNGPWADIYVRSLGPDVVQILDDALARTLGQEP